MLGVAITSVIAFITLLLIERSARNKKIKPELSRKIPHVAGSLAIAIWPFFVGMQTVAVLGLIFTVAALAVIKLKLFPHARFVYRRSWGEVLFGLGVTFAALIGPNQWVFASAMLYLGVADGVAALIGARRGKRIFTTFGHVKSLEGSAAFVVAAFLITIGVVFVAPSGLEASWPLAIWLPLSASVLEATLPYGLDNLVLPVFVTVILSNVAG